VTVEFLNERAEPVRVEAEGWYARILQHEIDHLYGKLYIDRMHMRTFCTVENFEQHWKSMPTAKVVAKLG
jgi:peptide deformylase